MFNLIPYLSVCENITLPCRMNRSRAKRVLPKSVDEVARELAAHLGIEAMIHASVTDLSVGQQQRVAAARALIGKPDLIIADEPTSALDHQNKQQFLDILFREVEACGATLLFVSHELELGKRFDQVVSLPDINTVTSI